MTVAAALGRGSRNEPVHCLVGEKRRLHVQHCEIDVVAMPGLGATRQGRKHANGCVHAGHDVDNWHADLLWSAARQAVAFAGDAHQSAHGLDHEIIGGGLALRTRLSKASDRAINDFRVNCLQAIIVQTEAP